MNKYDIWWACSGPCTGDEGKPTPPLKIASNIQGDSFHQAVFNWYINQDDAALKYGGLQFNGKEEIILWSSRLQPTSSGLFKEYILKYPEDSEYYISTHPELIDEIDPMDLI